MTRDAILTQLGRRIKTLRKDKKLKQNELAALCNFEKASMSRIESGVTNATILTLLKISKALSVDIRTLLDEPGTTTTIIRHLPENSFESQVRDKVASLRMP
jgi:transcriptional regulator with XRE-family HTH domain